MGLILDKRWQSLNRRLPVWRVRHLPAACRKNAYKKSLTAQKCARKARHFAVSRGVFEPKLVCRKYTHEQANRP